MENIKWCRKKLKNGKLIINSTPKLNQRAINILMPKLKSKLDQLKNEVLELEVMIKALNN